MIRSSMLCALALWGLAAPGAAWAGKVVLPPLLADATVDDGQRAGMHQLIASELDFHPEVTDVIPVGSAVAPNLDCLDSAACLKGVALANGGDQLLAGTVTGAVDGGLSLELVFFDGTTISTRKSFSVPRDSTALANAMTPIVKDVLGGGASGTVIGAGPSESDFEINDEVAMAPVAAPAPAPAPIAAPAPAPAPVAAPAPAPAPVASKPAAPAAPLVPAMTGASRRLAAASMATGLGTAKLPPPPTNREPLSYTRRNPLDLDDTPSSTRSRSRSSSVDLDHLVQITVHGGVSNYRSLGFAMIGGEVAVAVYQGLHVLAGADLYAGKAPLPFEVQVETGQYGRWAWFFPYNAGAKYAFGTSRLQPYAGADILAAQYAAGSWALGARVRGGADLMVTDNFGLNGNLSLGYWSGARWDATWGVPGSGVLPQVTVGTVLAF
jgi:hypothetical protein